jgi:Icc protein
MSSVTHRLEAAGDTLELVQITDTHLGREAGGTLLSMDTDFSLRCVIDLVRQEHPRLDLVLATGDIADNGAPTAYRRARDYFDQLPAETFWLPGNHDCAQTMARELGAGGALVRFILSAHWQIIMLNSQVPGEVGGTLGDSELDWLKACLEQGAQTGLHSLVCLHHQPRPMGCAWIDSQQLSDGDEFWQTLSRYPEVRGVLWGHVHQQLDSFEAGVRLMSSPSSCVQFAPGEDDFKVDDMPPGYRWMKLHADGEIETGVARVMGVDFPVDLESSGYE